MGCPCAFLDALPDALEADRQVPSATRLAPTRGSGLEELAPSYFERFFSQEFTEGQMIYLLEEAWSGKSIPLVEICIARER